MEKTDHSIEQTQRIVVDPSPTSTATVQIEENRKTVRIHLEEDAPASTPAPSSTIANFHALYAIQAKVGGGGMGVVYLAKERRLDRFVAVKRLNASANCDAGLRKRFLNEAHSVAALNHIHIVHVYALGEDEEGPYIVMEYVEGPSVTTGSRIVEGTARTPNPPLSLETQVAENGQYTLNEAVDLVIKLSKAIVYAHSYGVIHRDLKPSNILLDMAGEPKIVDFGLARRTDSDENKLTQPGEKLLSIGYGAPEQESDASVSDERADVYGLGGILFFAITGQNPRFFREQDIPITIREVLNKALATDREQRWSSAQEFLDALQAVQSRTRVEQPPAKTTWRCKWCDTINPVSIRFCSECGWDGVNQCPECGVDNIVGMQYCGRCGADIRVYESMQSLLSKMRLASQSVDFEKTISLASRAQGFDPAGPAGRTLLEEISRIHDQANRKMKRREQLKELIPMELKAENYERAKGFVEEYRKLSGDNLFYSEEYNQVSERIVQRDYKRAHRAFRTGDTNQALTICENILRSVSPENTQFLSLRQRILTRRILRRFFTSLFVLFLLGLLYLAAFPITLSTLAPKRANQTLATFFQPAKRLYLTQKIPYADLLLAYAKQVKCSREQIEELGRPALHPESHSVTSGEFASVEPKELTLLLRQYKDDLDAIHLDYAKKIEEWPNLYLKDLEKLSNERRMAGDYTGYNAAIEEWERYEQERIWKPADEANVDLTALQNVHIELTSKYRNERDKAVSTLRTKTIQAMQGMLSQFTKENNLAAAKIVNDELKHLTEVEK